MKVFKQEFDEIPPVPRSEFEAVLKKLLKVAPEQKPKAKAKAKPRHKHRTIRRRQKAN